MPERTMSYTEMCDKITALNDNPDCGLKDCLQMAVDWAFGSEEMTADTVMNMFRALMDVDPSYDVDDRQIDAVLHRFSKIITRKE